MMWGSIPGRGKGFFLLQNVQTALGPTQPPIQWVMAAFSLGWSGWDMKPLLTFI